MDLDALKEKSRAVAAPDMDRQLTLKGGEDMNNLIAILKAADEKERKALKKGFLFFIIAAFTFAVSFFAIFLKPADEGYASATLLRGTLAAVYVLMVVLVARKIKEMSRIDYNEPVRAFLKKAERRYAFMLVDSMLLAVAVILFMGYGVFLYFQDVAHRYFDVTGALVAAVVTVVFLGLVCTLGVWATRKGWKQEKEEIWLQTKEIRRELETRESDQNAVRTS